MVSRKIEWAGIASSLNENGFAVIPKLLPASNCRSLIKLYDDDSNFRSRVVMARHGYGRGEYKYFSYSLPQPVSELRSALYPRLADIAND